MMHRLGRNTSSHRYVELSCQEAHYLLLHILLLAVATVPQIDILQSALQVAPEFDIVGARRKAYVVRGMPDEDSFAELGNPRCNFPGYCHVTGRVTSAIRGRRDEFESVRAGFGEGSKTNTMTMARSVEITVKSEGNISDVELIPGSIGCFTRLEHGDDQVGF